MTARRAADVFVECLEAEGVRHVFGIPGEETLDLNHALEQSSIAFVPVRHEQGGAYMADMVGRLTGRAGVCLGTLGPGALNLVTAVADASLDHAPLVALTGQRAVGWMHKESHQVVDVVEVMRPITKFNARMADPRCFRRSSARPSSRRGGEARRDASRAARGRHGRAARCDPARAPRAVQPEPAARELMRAVELACPRRAGRARRQRRAARGRGAGAARVRPRDRHRRRRDVHGQGRDRLRGPARARHRRRPRPRLRPRRLRRRRPRDRRRLRPRRAGAGALEPAPRQDDRRRRQPSRRDRRYFTPAVELVGNVYHVLTRLAEECRGATAARRASDLPPARRRARTPRVRARRRPLPDAAAAGAVGVAPRARARRHPRVRRRAAQALDRPDVRSA